MLAALEGAMWFVAVVGLGLAAWMVGDACAYRWQTADDFSTLGNLSTPSTRGHEATPAPAHAWPEEIEPGTPIARLVVPHLDISAVVAEGITSTVLRRAIGHVPSSARPGETGNVVLAGHRDTVLRPLEGIREGDIVFLDGPAGRERYEVEWISVVAPEDVHVADATPHAALTLITCHPFRYVGTAPNRFVVRARRLAPPDPAG